MIPGPSGLLEIRLAGAQNRHWAILCHPHPLYGGSMDDAVLDVARAQVEARGAGSVLFNFRGVGASEGRHDGGSGEVDDALAVARWLMDAHCVSSLTLIGYSFGSSVAWRALAHLDAANFAVLIAPPIGSMAFPPIVGATATVVAGTHDPFVDGDALEPWLASQPGSTHIAIEGADHFFGAYRGALENGLDEALQGRNKV